MKITLSTIKADIGGIGGHTRPSDEVINAVNDVVNNTEYNLLLDYYIGYTGDDIHIIMCHQHGLENNKIHRRLLLNITRPILERIGLQNPKFPYKIG